MIKNVYLSNVVTILQFISLNFLTSQEEYATWIVNRVHGEYF